VAHPLDEGLASRTLGASSLQNNQPSQSSNKRWGLLHPLGTAYLHFGFAHQLAGAQASSDNTTISAEKVAMPSQPSNAGIITDEKSGERKIPESLRPDGTTRKAIKIRPGYRPPEDVEVYKNRTAETFRARGVPGAEGLKDNKPESSSAASNKNAKRREARKKAKVVGEGDDAENKPPPGAAEEELDPEAEKEKKARNLKKKLKQAKELRDKKDTGQSLLPEQIAKVIKINELIRELDALGFDAEGEPKAAAKGDSTAETPGSTST
jgi:partner of Y14 and mago